MKSNRQDAALYYLSRGLSIIPLNPRSKFPHTRLLPDAVDADGAPIIDERTGKVKKSWKPFMVEPPTEEEARIWWTTNPDANMAIVTGKVSGVVILDIDGPEGLKYFNEQGGAQDTPKVQTGRGYHLYFQHPGFSVRNFQQKIEQLDLRGDGGYALLPPSDHPDGGVYRWVVNLDTPIAPMPGWLLDLIAGDRTPAAKPLLTSEPLARGGDNFRSAALDGEFNRILSSPEGDRNNQLNRSAYNLGQLIAGGELSRGEVEGALAAAALRVGLPSGEAVATIASGINAGMAQKRDRRTRRTSGGREAMPAKTSALTAPAPTQAAVYQLPPIAMIPVEINMTDLGNARRFVGLHGGRVRYVSAWKKWVVWNGAAWAIDDSAEVERMAKDTVRAIYAEAAQIESTKDRKALAAHGLRTESASKLANMVALARSEPGIPAAPAEMDRDNWLLNCENGTFDLRADTFRPADPADLLTLAIPVTYDPAATCPTWKRFLHTITGDNGNLYGFIQRAIGYSLTGETSEQVLFFMYGTGANGKSTFMNTIKTMLGGYCKQTPTQTLMSKGNDGINNDVAGLRGARVVAAIETEENQRLAESFIKQITGGDTIAARFLYGEYFEFIPTFKVWLAGNHKPAIRGTDHGIWRRIMLIPFLVTIPDDQKDKHLGEKLQAELPGILNWAIEGCLEWQKRGLDAPPEVLQATESYRAEMDVIATFIEEKCVTGPNVKAPVMELFKVYEAWCESTGEIASSKRKFNQRLVERGYKNERSTMGAFWWRGIGIKTTEVTLVT